MIFNIDDPQWLIKVLQDEDIIVPASSSITVVQHKSIAGSAGATQTLAFTSNNTAGNTLIYCTSGNGSTNMAAATDNNSNTIVNATSLLGSGGAIRIDYVASCNGGANTITGNQSSGNRIHIHLWEISGLASKVVDKTNTGTQTNTSQSISTSSATTAANELVLGFFYDQPNNDSLTAGSGFSPSEFSDGGISNESAMSEVKIVSATGVQTATATCGSGANVILQAIATFK